MRDVSNHVFVDTKTVTGLGDYKYFRSCENCGAKEFSKQECNYGSTFSSEYIEKALKAVARV